jgi:hypothetical protein
MSFPHYLTIHEVFRGGQRIGEIRARWAGSYVGEPVHNLTGIPEGGALIDCAPSGFEDAAVGQNAADHFAMECSDAYSFVPPINPGFDTAY